MKKLLVASLAVLFGMGIAAAETSSIPDFVVERGDPTDSTMRITWGNLTNEQIGDADGFAIQWAKTAGEIGADKPEKVRQFLTGTSRRSVNLLYSIFDDGQPRYFRIYTYKKDGRKTYLYHGSKMIKWYYNPSDGTEIQEESIVTDPVIIEEETPIDENGDLVTFPIMSLPRVHDTHAVISWSRVSISSSQADKILLSFSEKSDMSEPFHEAKIDLENTSAKVTGLPAGSTIYVQGAFYDDGTVFGQGAIKTLKTYPAYTDTQNTRLDYLRKQGLISSIHDTVIKIDGSGESEVISTTPTTTTPTASAPLPTEKVARIAAIKARLSSLRNEISSLERELASLEGTSSTSKTTTTSSTNTSSKFRTIRRNLPSFFRIR